MRGEGNDDRADGTCGMVSPQDSTRGPPRCSVEKSVGIGKAHSVGASTGEARCNDPQASRSKSSASLSPETQARHDTLVTTKALMQFPPKDGDPKIYQEWSIHVKALLDFTDGRPRPDPTRAPTIDDPEAAGDKTRK